MSQRGGPLRVTQQLGVRAAGEWPETVTRGVCDDTVPSCPSLGNGDINK